MGFGISDGSNQARELGLSTYQGGWTLLERSVRTLGPSSAADMDDFTLLAMIVLAVLVIAAVLIARWFYR